MSWDTVKLAEVSKPPQYGAGARGTLEPVGPLFVRQTDITAGRIDWASVPFCDLPAEEFNKYALSRGDLLISRLGNGVGNAAYVKEPKDAIFAGYLVRFQINPEKANSRFVGYQLMSPAWRDHVASFRSGAAQPTLNAQQMGAFEFRLPPLVVQQEIAEMLGALDDKIESNTRVLISCQALADQIFLEQATEIRTLAEVAKIQMGSSPPGESYNFEEIGTVFFQGTRDFGFRYPTPRVWTTSPVRFADRGETLISVRAPVGELNRAREKCCIGRGLATAGSTELPSTLFYALRNSSTAWEPYHSEGTVFGSINRRDLEALSVKWVAESSIQTLETRLQSLDALIESLTLQCENLVALRESLLPPLLTGRISIGEFSSQFDGVLA